MTKGRGRTAAGEASTFPAFSGIPREACTFFADLAKNNNREWFQSHKATFERACHEPLKALTVALDPPLGAQRLTRIYKDVRFSKDKSPYHTHVSARVSGMVFWLSADGLYVGTGIYMPDPAALRRLREGIDRDASGQSLADIVASLRHAGYTVGSHEAVATVPRGFSADHARLELLRMKDIHAGRTLKPAELSSAAAVARVRRVGDDVAPFRAWLRRHVGPTSCA